MLWPEVNNPTGTGDVTAHDCHEQRPHRINQYVHHTCRRKLVHTNSLTWIQATWENPPIVAIISHDVTGCRYNLSNRFRSRTVCVPSLAAIKSRLQASSCFLFKAIQRVWNLFPCWAAKAAGKGGTNIVGHVLYETWLYLLYLHDCSYYYQ